MPLEKPILIKLMVSVYIGCKNNIWMVIPYPTDIKHIVYHQGVEYWADCAPTPEKFDISPEVVYICNKYCVKIFQKVSMSFPMVIEFL